MDFCAAEDILLRAKGVEEAVINEQELWLSEELCGSKLKRGTRTVAFKEKGERERINLI